MATTAPRHASLAPRSSIAGNVIVWLGFVLLCNSAGYASSLAAREKVTYASLNLPSFAPPSWAFPVAWTTLYVLMGTATFLVWRGSAGASRTRAMIAFAVQLALNAAWTPIFFGMDQYAAGLAVIIAIWIAVLVMMVMYYRRVRTAGVMIAPLLVWVSFAAALNAAIVQLN